MTSASRKVGLVPACIVLVFCFLAAPACADERAGAIYEPDVDAAAAIDTALAEAAARQVPTLIVFGANWCHDSRGFADLITSDETLAPFMAGTYQTVFVDIGTRHLNLDQAGRFGVEAIYGTPTLVVAGSDGAVLNAATVHDWRAVDNAGDADLSAYFARLAGAVPPLTPDATADIAEAAQSWPPYIAAMDGLDALPDAERDAAQAYYTGLARSLARSAMGREGRVADLAIAALEDVEALDLPVETDMTAAVIARMARSEIDLEARRQSDLADTAQALAEG